MKDLLTLKVVSKLETADDGDTCYYGGTYKVTVSDGREFERYFRGSDRNSVSPAELILGSIEDELGFVAREDDEFDECELVCNIDSHLSDATTMLLLVDEHGVITQMEVAEGEA